MTTNEITCQSYECFCGVSTAFVRNVRTEWFSRAKLHDDFITHQLNKMKAFMNESYAFLSFILLTFRRWVFHSIPWCVHRTQTMSLTISFWRENMIYELATLKRQSPHPLIYWSRRIWSDYCIILQKTARWSTSSINN